MASSDEEDLEALRQAALATLKNKTLEKPCEVPVIVTPGDVLANQKRAAQEQNFYDHDFLNFGRDVGDPIPPVSMLEQGNADFLRNFQAHGRGMRGRIRGRGRGRGGRGVSNANTNLIVISTVPMEGEEEKPKGDQTDKENKPVFLRPQDKWAFGLTDENSRSSMSSPSRPKDKFSRYNDQSDSEEEEDWYEEEEDEEKKEEKSVEEEEEENEKEVEGKGSTTTEGSDSDLNDTFSDKLKAQENDYGSEKELDEKDLKVNEKDMSNDQTDVAVISQKQHESDKENEKYIHSEAMVYDTGIKDADNGAKHMDTLNNAQSNSEKMDSGLELEKETLEKESGVENTVKREPSPLVSESSQSTWSRRRRRRGSVASSSQESDSESDSQYGSKKVSESDLGRSSKPELDLYSNSDPKSESDSDSNSGPISESDMNSNSDSKSELDTVSKRCSRSGSDSDSNSGSKSESDSGSNSDSESDNESLIGSAGEKVESDTELGMSPVKKSSVSVPWSGYDHVSDSENDSDDELHFRRKGASSRRMRRKSSGGGIESNSKFSNKSKEVSDSEISESGRSHKIQTNRKSPEAQKTVRSASKIGSNLNSSASKDSAVEKKNSNYIRTVAHKSRSGSKSLSDSLPQPKHRKLQPHSRSSSMEMKNKSSSHSRSKHRKARSRSRSRSESVSVRKNSHSRSRSRSNQAGKNRKSQRQSDSAKEKNKRTDDKHYSNSKSETKRRKSSEQRELSHSDGGSEKSVSSFSDMDTDSDTDLWRDKKKGVSERHMEDIARERRKRMAQDSPKRIERDPPETRKYLPDSSGLENRRERVFYKRNQEKRFVEEESDSEAESNRGLRRGLVSVVLGDGAKGHHKNSDLDDTPRHQSRKFDFDRTGNKSSSLIRSIGVKKSEEAENTDSSDEGLKREGRKSPVINITFTTGQVEKPRPSVHERLGLPVRRDRSSGNSSKTISEQLTAVTVPTGGKKIKLSGLSSKRKMVTVPLKPVVLHPLLYLRVLSTSLVKWCFL